MKLFFFKEFFSINFFFIANLFYFINFHYFHFSKKTLLQNLYFFLVFLQLEHSTIYLARLPFTTTLIVKSEIFTSVFPLFYFMFFLFLCLGFIWHLCCCWRWWCCWWGLTLFDYNLYTISFKCFPFHPLFYLSVLLTSLLQECKDFF